VDFRPRTEEAVQPADSIPRPVTSASTEHAIPGIQSGSCEPTPFKVIIPSARAVNLIPCVRSLMEMEPDLPLENIIVIDDGARSAAEQQLPGLHWITGIKPFVYARNINLGLRAAGTDVILLNDDTRLITPRGLTLLAREVQGRPEIGICSSGIRGVIGNPNQCAMGRSGFRDEQELLAFVCVYIPKRVYDWIGPLDERFNGYGFDDTDYCARVLAADLRLVIWDGCVVDHSGELTSTFRSRPDIDALFAQNRDRFDEKWGRNA
jgi:GT2 family glycosyltransferase